MTRRGAAHSAAAAMVAAAALAAGALAQTNGTRATAVVTPDADASSDNIAFSQDNRVARFLAFDSSATNLVAGDLNGRRDVFAFERGSGDGVLSGRTFRVSVSSAGVEGDGDSRLPSISGQTGRPARCVVFESQSTNLAPDDTSPDWDVFLHDKKNGRTELISIGHTDARTGIVDGECEFVTFESGGSVYVRDLDLAKTTRIARGTNPDQQTSGKGVAYERGGQVYYQGYARFRNRGRPKVKRTGREVLASRNVRGRRGNGISRNPSLDDAGNYVAFESTATNLCEGGRRGCTGVGGRDRNGATSDIFRRTLNRRKAPTKDFMQMVSYSQGCSKTKPKMRAVNQQGNGPSNNPAMTGAGENIVFDSEATNLRESSGILVADANGSVRDIYYWNFPRGRRCGNVSRESRGSQPREEGSGQPLNGPSVNPASSNRANYVGWTSAATGDHGERNGPEIQDLFLRFLGGQ